MTQKKTSSKVIRFLGRLLSIVAGLALLAWVLRSYDLANVGRALQSASYLYLFPIGGAIAVNCAIRALRWGTLFNDDRVHHWGSLFIAMMIGNLANNVLPARSGDIVRAYVLGQRDGTSKTKVLATVIVERIADLLVTLFFMALMTRFYNVPAWLERAGVFLAIICFIALMAIIIIYQWGMEMVDWFIRILSFLPKSLLHRLKTIGENFAAGISGLRTRQNILPFIFYTSIIWLLEVTSVWLIAKMFALPLSFGGALFVLLSVAFGLAIPAFPGAIGTYEFFAVNGLALLGLTGAATLSFALLLHVITFLAGSAIGVVCMIWSGYNITPTVQAID